jgi:tetratricopeptide (TPR) repeat protein
MGFALKIAGVPKSEIAQRVQEAAKLLTDLVQRFPDDPAYQQHLARTFLNLGTVIRSPKQGDDARASYDRAIALLRSLTERFPEQPDYQHELGVVYNNAGNLLSSHADELEDAGALHRQARTLFQKLAADFPKVPLYRQELANTWNSIGYVESLKEKQAETLNAWNQAASLLENLLTEYPEVATYQGDLGMVLGNLGLACFAQSQLPQAREHLERSVDRLRKTLAISPDHAIYREFLRDNCQNLAEVLVVSGDHAAAAQSARALTGIFPELAKDRYAAACFLARCVRLAADDSRLGADQRQTLTRTYADESLAALRKAIEQGFDDLAQLRRDRDSVFEAVETRSDFQAIVAQLTARPSTP